MNGPERPDDNRSAPAHQNRDSGTPKEAGSSAPGTPESGPADPGAPFLESERGRWSYGDLYAFTRRLEQAASKHGPDPEHPLLLPALDEDRTVALLAGCWLLGIPFLPLSPAWSREERLALLDGIDPAALCSDGETADELFGGDQRLPRLDPPRWPPSEEEPRSLFARPVSADSTFALLSTSGSAGEPKLVPLRRRQLLAAERAPENRLRPDPRGQWLLTLPLSHAGGLAVLLRSLLAGAPLYRAGRFEPGRIAGLLGRNRKIGIASLVPTMLRRLLDLPGFAPHPGFRSILLGGGPIAPSLLREATGREIPVTASYGMTETFGQIAAREPVAPDENPEKPGLRLFSPNRVEIRDPHGRPLPAGKSGTILLRGPQLFEGYLTKSGLDRSAFDSDGWFDTGDYGHIDERGCLHVETRREDLILSGGENVVPAEVERALMELDEVREAAVIGVDDPEWGQAVVAFVTPAVGEKTDEERLRSILGERLSPWKIPKRIYTLDEMPLTGPGKIHRQKLRELCDSGKESR